MKKQSFSLLLVALLLFGASPIAKVKPKKPDARRLMTEARKATNNDSSGICLPSSVMPSSHGRVFGIKTVVIDAGHGGKDPGCLGKNLKEKDVALAIALKLGKYIEQRTSDVKVIYTRSTDVFVELDERAAIANKYKADLFICIHCNTACSQDKKTRKVNCNEEVFGTETYVMGLHKTQANLNVAKRENEAILLEKNYQKRYDGFDPNSETGYILLTMQQNAYLMQSLNFASKIQKQVKEKAGRVDKGVQQAGFLVLWRTAMPSVLIETEFLSSPSSEHFVGSDKGQDYMARSIFSAFRQYKDEVEGKLAKYDDDIEETPRYVPEKDTAKAGGNGQKSVGNKDKQQDTQDSKAGDKKQETGNNKQPAPDKQQGSKPQLANSNEQTIQGGEQSKKDTAAKEPVLERDDIARLIPKDTDQRLPVAMDTARLKLRTRKDTAYSSLPDRVDTNKLRARSATPKADSLAGIPKPLLKKDTANNSIGGGQGGLVVYKVQFMSASQRIPLLSDKFKGLKDVGEYMDGVLYKYTAGEFRTIDDAMKYRTEMQSKGYKDCFVVKFKDGKRMKEKQ